MVCINLQPPRLYVYTQHIDSLSPHNKKINNSHQHSLRLTRVIGRDVVRVPDGHIPAELLTAPIIMGLLNIFAQDTCQYPPYTQVDHQVPPQDGGVFVKNGLILGTELSDSGMKPSNIRLLPAPGHFSPAAHPVPLSSSLNSQICRKRKLDVTVTEAAISSILARVGSKCRQVKALKTCDERTVSSYVKLGPNRPTVQKVYRFQDLMSTTTTTTTKIAEHANTFDKLPSTVELGLIPCPVVQHIHNIAHCSQGLSEVADKSNAIPLASIGENILTDEKIQIFEDLTATKISSETTLADQLVKEPVVINKGVSLIEHFTADQLKAHISSLKPGDDHQVDHDPCQLCGIHLLHFTPTPIYCSTCEARIKHGVPYYSAPNVSVPHYFCKKCFTASKRGVIKFNGKDFVKNRLINNKNEGDATEESWVECDKCKKWQHQICALYNSNQDLSGDATYTCPICCLNGGRRPALSTTKAKGAKDLPTTKLSDYIETRLMRRLKEDKREVSNIVVREMLSVDGKLKLQDKFYKLVRDSGHHPQLPYRSRAIVVFQNMDGVDVCIFIMFVQEYGSECSNSPNQRSVYISYLDSVKYFRPDIKIASGEAIRTFVYHQIMISYLDYCKKRGFATCYIWSCPPSKGEDFIFNCHPINQRTPKPEKLQQWYQAMLTKAKKENVVVDCTNIYDKFFASYEKSKRISAARLPYFDGAYWNLVAENLIKDMENEKGGPLSVNTLKKVLSTRALKDMKCGAKPSANNIKDILLMHKLGNFILPTKENYIVANLHHVCANCDEVILSSTRWSAKDQHLCEQCYCSNRKYAGKQQNDAYAKFVNDVPVKIIENDTIIENSFCENRVMFLKFCQEHNYQFDTLRRAKHSSMMLLHKLLNS